jgi:hypothetical protein
MEAFDEDLYEAQLGLTELMYWSQYGDSTFERNDANYLFIRDLVKALRMDGAFDFPFDVRAPYSNRNGSASSGPANAADTEA